MRLDGAIGIARSYLQQLMIRRMLNPAANAERTPISSGVYSLVRTGAARIRITCDTASPLDKVATLRIKLSLLQERSHPFKRDCKFIIN
jgi:hypothetical protein